MKYSIIIPTYNHFHDCLKPCLDSIIKYTDFSNVEVIVVANGCTDETHEYVESLGDPFRLIILPYASGYAMPVNKGIHAATGEFCVLLNNDCVLLPQDKDDWLNVLVKPFYDIDRNVGITGPLRQHSPAANHSFLIFFCAMIKTSLFTDVGLLDEIFWSYGEDTDLCIRAENKGYEVVKVPDENPNYEAKFADAIRMVGNFPIYHAGNVSHKDTSKDLCIKNDKILKERYDINIEKAKLCDGYMNEAELTWLAQQAKKANIFIEVGSWHGRSSRAIGDNVKGKVYCVDHFLGSDEEAHHRVKHIDHFHEFQKNNFDLMDSEKIQVIKNNSKDAALLLKEKGILADIIFIDAGHTFEDVKQDIINWLPLLKEGGIMCGHDYNPGWQGVIDAVHHSFGNIDGIAPLTSIWYKQINKIKMNKITAYVSTKGRYTTTLSGCLLSIINQTRTPDELVIWQDDPETFNMQESSTYRNIFALMDLKGIEWKVNYGEGKGQVLNHQKMLEIADTEWIWRVDDDNFVEADVLEKLIFYGNNANVGAIASAVIDPTYRNAASFISGKIEHINISPNIQWQKGDFWPIEVEHLYSSFLYRKEAGKHGYNMNLSPVGHREETLFTYEMHKNGWRLLVIPSVITWHLRETTGGIRAYNDGQLWNHDENIFNEKMKSLGVTFSEIVPVNMDTGIGDHWMFKPILERMLEQDNNNIIMVACCYPDVFKDIKNEKLVLISIAEGHHIFGSKKMEDLNLYKWADMKGWNKHMSKAL